MDNMDDLLKKIKDEEVKETVVEKTDSLKLSASETEAKYTILIKRVSTGSSVLFLIALMAFVHTIFSTFGIHFFSFMGLGLTSVITLIGKWLGRFLGPQMFFIALVINLLICSCYALFSFCLKKYKMWAILTGIIAYLIDTIIVAIYMISGCGSTALYIHIAFTIVLLMSFNALREIKKLEANENFSIEIN
jgi:hypothetical protein